MLLRRLAMQHGRTTVFEPNGAAFWRALHRAGLRGLLGDLLHERGAFAGAQARARPTASPWSQATHRGVDGRLVVELRVAPSQPLDS